MSQTKVFITGVTGYIGGDLLYLINKRCPKWQVSCLVRDPNKSTEISKRYPTTRIVIGDLDSVDVIEREAAHANIIYHCASSDHMASALAISKGLMSNLSPPAYWIHTSGAGILTHQNFTQNNFETICAEEKIYDDWEHVNEITSLPDKAIHRHVEKIVLETSSGHEDQVKTAIVSPSAIYGVGRGTGNTKSKQVNMAVQLALKNHRALQMGNGTAVWHEIHVHDLSLMYVMLGEAAMSKNPDVTWNKTGYYLAENGSFTWGAYAQAIATEGLVQGYLDTNSVQSVDFGQAQKHHKLFPYLCGTTSRGVAKRARIVLGWRPKQISLMDDLPRLLKDEAKAMGLKSRRDAPRL